MSKPSLSPGDLKKLRQHPMVLALVFALIVGTAGLGYYLYQQVVQTSQREQALEQANQYAATLRLQTIDYLSERQQQLSTLAKKPLLVNALNNPDPSQLEAAEKQLLAWAPELSQGLLLNGDDRRLITQRHFAGQWMVEQVLSGEHPSPAAAYVDKQWQLLFSYPLTNQGGEIKGAMLAILPPETLAESLKASLKDNQSGLVELVQTTPGARSSVFVDFGNRSKALEPVVQPIKSSHWQLRFTGSRQLLGSTSPAYGTYFAFLTSLIVAALVLLYVLVRLTLHFHRDKSHNTRPKITTHHTHDDPGDSLHEQGDSFLEVIPSKAKAITSADEPVEEPDSAAESDTLPEVVFRDYDIRGIAGQQLTPAFAARLGKVLATRALARGEHSLIVARDGRESSEQLGRALEEGILSGGCHVVDIGMAPTPLLNFATHHLEASDCGVMVTASHNPAEYNGFKMFFQHHALCGEEIHSLRGEMEGELPDRPTGERSELDLSDTYLQTIVEDIVPAQGLKVILDAGNGVAGELASRLLEAIGCDVMPLYCEVDGSFPNHDPDPSVPANLDDLKLCVREQGAELGIALDGDGDRIVAVSAGGRIVWPDELLMIFARDVVSRHPGADVVFDIKSTRRLNALISSYGGRPVMWKTGHSHMYNKIIESQAPLGGEFSGHIFFHDRWHGFDDGLYAAARLIEIMNIREQGLDDILAGFEERVATPEIRIPVSEDTKFDIVEQLLEKDVFREGKVSTIDGLRVDFPKAWGLVRASNTSPALTLRFEAESDDALEKIQSLFRQQLRSIDNNLTF